MAMAGLCALTLTARAQNPEPAAPAPPAPPVQVEAPDAPAAPEAPTVEAPDTDAQSADREDFRPRRNRGTDRVAVGSNATLPKGQIATSVVSVLGSSTSDGEVLDGVVSVLGDTRVTGTTRDAVAVLGSVYLNGKASGDVVAVLGNVELGPLAEVNGDLVVVGGTLIRDPASVVHGEIENVVTMGIGSAEWLRPWAKYCLLYGRPLALHSGLGWAWGLALGFLALYVLIALLFKDPVDHCVRTFEAQPGKSILAAILTMLLTPVVFALLFITIIGIAFVPIAAMGWFLAGLFGKAVMLAWIGKNVLQLSNKDATFHTALTVLLGGLIVLVLYLIPFIGFIVYKTLGILGLGVAVYALLLAVKQKRGESGSGPGPTWAAASAGSGSAGFADAVPPGGSYATYTVPPVDSTFSASSESSSGATSAEPPPRSPESPPPPITPSAASTYPRAGFMVRMGALLIDIILVAVLLGILDSTRKAELIALATYGALMWKLKGTTIGGIVFGLQVVRVDGRPIDWATATVRALSCFLSLVVAGLGFIWIAIDPGRQAWHDKIAGTAVVRVPKGVSLL